MIEEEEEQGMIVKKTSNNSFLSAKPDNSAGKGSFCRDPSPNLALVRNRRMLFKLKSF